MFPRIWAAVTMILIAVTWPLWFPTQDSSAYPLIPWSSVTTKLVSSSRLSQVASGISLALCASLALAFFRRQPRRAAWLIIALLLGCSFLVDQHRIQPWAYQSFLYAVVFALFPPALMRRAIILIAVSIYLYSAIGKLDYQFAHTVGQEFLQMVTNPFGGLPQHWTPVARARMALLFPIGELVLGIGLLIPSVRRWFAVAAIVMHGMLLAILGPLGLNHSYGVLIWNLALIVQASRLFWRQDDWPEYQSSLIPGGRSRIALAIGFIAIALLAPMTERFGYWDHWTSWALYSPHNSRAELEVHQSAITKLPTLLRRSHDGDPDGDRWYRIKLDQWSLQARQVPIYPQARYQVGLCREIAIRYQLDDAVRVRRLSQSDRWTGRREESLFIGQRELSKMKP